MTINIQRRRVAIYKQDGTRHGGFGSAVPLETMEHELRHLGLDPQYPQTRLLPGQANKMGGVRTGCCNVFEIYEDEFEEQIIYIEEAGYRLWPEKDDPVSHLYEELDEVYDDEETDRIQLLPPEDRYAYCENETWSDTVPVANHQIDVSDVQPARTSDLGDHIATLQDKLVCIHNEGMRRQAHDFRADRLNLLINPETNRIVEFWIG